ncbi:hypothetical protein FJR11_01090 [Anabaena sp. UHCC 0187]|uniref:hypothetical protein n=1 Tax=Anabaena sp. UHCC 0187 TaxID=2590018 RepID=UPI0014476F3A|nr:hypothetical protein [Anabaena sp. UHCC 0187]MTJ11213.1 hypothetical protein [Anabaena sp. UHCC 0187]
MATIIISDLQFIEQKTFLYDLTSEQAEEILGTGILTGFLPFGRSSDVLITTVYDGINSVESAYRGPFSFSDNKIFTLDFSRTALYLIV